MERVAFNSHAHEFNDTEESERKILTSI